jgi:hypothetical protein
MVDRHTTTIFLDKNRSYTGKYQSKTGRQKRRGLTSFSADWSGSTARKNELFQARQYSTLP